MSKSTLQIYRQAQHAISNAEFSPAALAIISKLLEHQHKAYIVGGAVRDLLLGQQPKDFDIATDATPEQIKHIFQNQCRIIGKRFRLAHVYYNRELYEVATFRGDVQNDGQNSESLSNNGHILRDNIFGRIDEDAWRRDFSCNALYYDTENGNILDYCHGMQDIKDRQLKMIGDASQRIIEDPVRMIRAMRFQAKLGLHMSDELYHAISQQHNTIENVSLARLFDELVKLFHCGNALTAFKLMNDLNIFKHIFPQASMAITANADNFNLLQAALQSTDSRLQNNQSVTPIFLFACFLWPLALEKIEKYLAQGVTKYEATNKAANEVFMLSRRTLAIPKIIQVGIRDIWMLQNRFHFTRGKKVLFTLEQHRFRAAFDFLLLRQHESPEMLRLAEWWTQIQTLSKAEQKEALFARTTQKKKSTKAKKTQPSQQKQS